MSFRAFVVGADYHLQFARADAERIADALEKLGYVLPEPRLPPPDENSDSISVRLKKFAADSKPDDTMLFYFAGHGVIENGILYLVLDGYIPGRAMGTCLMMNTVSGIFQGSTASSKLIILDCCHAGKSFSLADFHADNYAILTASESFEKALEFKDRQAGFLSWHLCNAFAEESDLKTLWNDPYKKGLAAAVSTLAWLHGHFRPNFHLSKKALLQLAIHRNPEYPQPASADWGFPLACYLHTYRNLTNKREDAENFVGFVKDEFADKIVQEGSLSCHHAET